MAITENAKKYHEKMFPNKASQLARTDPELIALFDNFAFDEVVGQDDVDDRTRMLAFWQRYWAVKGLMSIDKCSLER